MGRWTAHWWPAVPVTCPDPLAVNMLCHLLGRRGESQQEKKHELMPEKIFAEKLSSVCQRQGGGQVGVQWSNKITGRLSCSGASLAPPFCAFASLDGVFLLSQSLNLVLVFSSVLITSLPSLTRDAGFRSVQLTCSKNK